MAYVEELVGSRLSYREYAISSVSVRVPRGCGDGNHHRITINANIGPTNRGSCPHISEGNATACDRKPNGVLPGSHEGLECRVALRHGARALTRIPPSTAASIPAPAPCSPPPLSGRSIVSRFDQTAATTKSHDKGTLCIGASHVRPRASIEQKFKGET